MNKAELLKTAKPILFNTDMVRAILEGRKTETRRPMKNGPLHEGRFGFSMFTPTGHISFRRTDVEGLSAEWFFKMPYQKGDILYVRETWAIYQTVDYIRRTDGRAFSEVSDGLYAYKADGYDTIKDLKEHIKLMAGLGCEAIEVEGDRWHPSIHMPKEAARIFLRVTEKRVERLQDIPEDGAIAEGIKDVFKHHPHHDGSVGAAITTNHISQFKYLWNSVYKNTPNDWIDNPWVWVIKFEVIKF